MAKRPTKSAAKEQMPPSIPNEKGIELLLRQIDSGKALIAAPTISEHEFKAWGDLSEQCVIKAFGRNSDRHVSFQNAGPWAGFVVDDYDSSEVSEWQDRLNDKVANLESSVDVLKLEIELANSSIGSFEVISPQPIRGDRAIFLVHGHDQAALHAVARFIEQLSLVPIVLHEQPNKGRTIIEKFIDHSQVGFAVVLLTPDDIGRSAKTEVNDEQFRARQNVILELGYFLGKLGRERVCPLYTHGVEIPSDYVGTAYTRLDDGGAWKLTLARELKSAGFAVDLNKTV